MSCIMPLFFFSNLYQFIWKKRKIMLFLGIRIQFFLRGRILIRVFLLSMLGLVNPDALSIELRLNGLDRNRVRVNLFLNKQWCSECSIMINYPVYKVFVYPTNSLNDLCLINHINISVLNLFLACFLNKMVSNLGLLTNGTMLLISFRSFITRIA